MKKVKNIFHKIANADHIMKKVKNIFHKIANADPMIWGYVMLNDRLSK